MSKDKCFDEMDAAIEEASWQLGIGSVATGSKSLLNSAMRLKRVWRTYLDALDSTSVAGLRECPNCGWTKERGIPPGLAARPSE